MKRALPDDVLLGFVNKAGWTSHLVYFTDDTFYSKNGYFKAIEFQSLKDFLKEHYWDTEEIVVYKVDEDKVRKVIAASVEVD